MGHELPVVESQFGIAESSVRSDRFIVRAAKTNRLKPHRGGREVARAVHAAPTGLGRISGRAVTINRPPRWGLARARTRPTTPAQRSSRKRFVVVLGASGARSLAGTVSVQGMQALKRILKLMFNGPVLSGSLVSFSRLHFAEFIRKAGR